MSHVSQIEIEIKDITALQAACTRLGLIWKENQRSYKWYGRWVGDYPLPENVTVEDLGKCLHAIEVPGASYEVGVTMVNGKLTLLWDFYRAGGLEQVIGINAEFLFDYSETEDEDLKEKKIQFSFMLRCLEYRELLRETQQKILQEVIKSFPQPKYWGSFNIERHTDSWKYLSNGIK